MPDVVPPRTLRWASVDFFPRAVCEDCGWEWSPSHLTRAEAKRHARTHPGHIVTVDTVMRLQYWTEPGDAR